MSDEKRQTRLLPFRRGRAGARAAGARGGENFAEDFAADAELTALLREWEAPPQGASARGRLLADFRATARPAPLWRRALTSQVRVPLPVAACAALAFLLSPLAFGARPWSQTASPAAAATPGAQAVRVVEVPVVQERVVERIVYVEKKERGGSRGVSSKAAGRESLAAEPAAAKRVEARRQEAPTPSTPGASAGYFTRVDMEDFQPADQMKIRILKRDGEDEK